MFSGSTLPFHKLSQGWRRGEGGRGQGSGKPSGETGKGTRQSGMARKALTIPQAKAVILQSGSGTRGGGF